MANNVNKRWADVYQHNKGKNSKLECVQPA